MADPWCEVCPVRQSCRGHPWHQDCSKGQKGSNRQFLSPKQSSGPCTSPKQYRAMKRHVSPTSGCNMLAIDSEKLATPMVSGWASACSATQYCLLLCLFVTNSASHKRGVMILIGNLWKFEVYIFCTLHIKVNVLDPNNVSFHLFNELATHTLQKRHH